MNIRCDLRTCGCPGRRALYTMRYASPELGVVFHDNPGAASGVLRRALGIRPRRRVFARGFGMVPFETPDPLGENGFRFGFVRNPWDRLVSVWATFRQTQPAHLESLFGVPGRELSFPEFVRHAVEVHYHHWEEQWKFVPPDRMDFVGRVETFERDLESVRDRLGLEAEPLPERKVPARTPYPAFYDDSTRAIVAGRWARDIELFEYTFGEEPVGEVKVGPAAVFETAAAGEAGA